ncbi:TlpA disulfide reductase family protein [Macrococcus sp. DPC7161]|uniref:TlpA family protein disulfide reductase n=1 Tax=Macrococcus sp. DPC7161 TaxID=2507060 RepID=UPI00100B8961|nr:TlpA disulfide reductase family protein [Macrococcus sp. DPC7161]RXK18043.1 TlpA family protein disulfide reductase [Macrococcus sp. DPC7161]
MKRLITVILAIVFVVLCIFSIKQVMQFNQKAPKHVTLQKHEITGKMIQDEDVVSLDSSKEKFGQYLTKEINVVNIWASWCDPCKKETPELIQFNKNLPQNVKLIGLNVKDKAQQRKAFLNKYNPNYQMIIANEAFMEQYKINFVPTTLFVSKKGEVLGVYTGELTEEHLKTLIDSVKSKL